MWFEQPVYRNFCWWLAHKIAYHYHCAFEYLKIFWFHKIEINFTFNVLILYFEDINQIHRLDFEQWWFYGTLIRKIIIAQNIIDGFGWYFQILIGTHGLLFLKNLNEIEIISSVILTTCLSKLLLKISTYDSLPLSLCIWIPKHILIS